MSYLLIRQIEKLSHLGFREKDEVLTNSENFTKYSDDQLDLIDEVIDTFKKLFKATGLMPSDREKSILAKHDITVCQENKGKAHCCHVLSTPYGKIEV